MIAPNPSYAGRDRKTPPPELSDESSSEEEEVNEKPKPQMVGIPGLLIVALLLLLITRFF